jgi:hypothetical protein
MLVKMVDRYASRRSEMLATNVQDRKSIIHDMEQHTLLVRSPARLSPPQMVAQGCLALGLPLLSPRQRRAPYNLAPLWME